jgi:hypothetical protein
MQNGNSLLVSPLLIVIGVDNDTTENGPIAADPLHCSRIIHEQAGKSHGARVLNQVGLSQMTGRISAKLFGAAPVPCHLILLPLPCSTLPASAVLVDSLYKCQRLDLLCL